MPTRTIHNTDAIAWLRARGVLEGCSVVTSLPDLSELSGLTLAAWSRWFEDTAQLVVESTPDEGVTIFFQSDIRHEGLWVDKGALVAAAAARASTRLLSHKIVCRVRPGTLTPGRASYSHLLAYSRGVRPLPERATADVIPDAGEMPTRKSMGVNACVDACELVRRETKTRTIVDPFCGAGTVLAVANAMGLDAVGVDRSEKMCRLSEKLRIELPQ